MRRILLPLALLVCAAGLVTAIGDAASNGPLVFLSTQLRPIAEAQRMRNLMLKDFAREVDYVTALPRVSGTRRGRAAQRPAYDQRPWRAAWGIAAARAARRLGSARQPCPEAEDPRMPPSDCFCSAS